MFQYFHVGCKPYSQQDFLIRDRKNQLILTCKTYAGNAAWT
jgi:hypothetical protein